MKKHGIKIIDIDMSFGSMIIFMVKWVIASIPAAIILFIIAFITSKVMLAISKIMLAGTGLITK